MRLLHWSRPGINEAEVIVLALEVERAVLGPGADNEIMGFAEALTEESGIDLINIGFCSQADHHARNDPTATYGIEHGNLFSHSEGMIIERKGVAENKQFCS